MNLKEGSPIVLDPSAIDLAPPNSVTYRRKLDRDAHALGVSLTGSLKGMLWAVLAQLNRATERQLADPLQIDPPTDKWHADGWAGAASTQVPLVDGLVLVTLSGRYYTLSGGATRMDLQAPHFAVDQSRWYVMGELWLMPEHGWTGALRLGTGRERWKTNDSLARVASTIETWMPTVAVELARELPASFTVAVGAGWIQHAPWGSIPDASALTEAYQKWIAPELSLYASKAAATAWTATVRWPARRDLHIWVRGTLASLSGASGATRLPLGPEGSRDHRSLTLGLTMQPP